MLSKHASPALHTSSLAGSYTWSGEVIVLIIRLCTCAMLSVLLSVVQYMKLQLFPPRQCMHLKHAVDAGMLCTLSWARERGFENADIPLHVYGPPGLADYIRYIPCRSGCGPALTFPLVAPPTLPTCANTQNSTWPVHSSQPVQPLYIGSPLLTSQSMLISYLV